jgi:ferric enterobactin receptor
MKFSLLWVALLLASPLFSQTSSPNYGYVTGILQDSLGLPIEGVTVEVRAFNGTSGVKDGLKVQTSDGKVDSLIQGTVQGEGKDSLGLSKRVSSDAFGRFTIYLPVGCYELGFSSVQTQSLRIREICLQRESDSVRSRDLGKITLQPLQGQMDEVVVVAEKPLFEEVDGVLTMNVSVSAGAANSSTAELLKNMPMVATDPDGKLLLRGREPRILIDNKPTELNGQQLADLLESLPGSAIEKIEMMMNPPPEYAQEEGGVINIVTKKGKIGFTGRINSFYGTRGEAGLNSSLNYRDQKWSLGLLAGTTYGRTLGNNSSTRTNFYNDSTNSLLNSGDFKNGAWRPQIRLSADYDKDKYQQFSFVFQTNVNQFDNGSINAFENVNRFEQTNRFNTRQNFSEGVSLTPSGNFSYTLKSKKKPGRSVRILGNYNQGIYDMDRVFLQQFFAPEDKETLIAPDSTQNQFTRNRATNFSLRVNYTQPTKIKTLSWSSGFHWLANRNHNKLAAEYIRRSDQQLIPIPELANDFNFNQDVLGWRQSLVLRLKKKWSVTGGATLETTVARFQINTGTGDDARNQYAQLLPQLNARKQWTKNRSGTLAYRRTIRRPGIRELNPTIDNSNPFSLRVGNPYLMPAVSDNIDLTLTKYQGKTYMNASLGINFVNDIIQPLRRLISDNVTELTYANLSGRTEYQAGLWGGYSFSKAFRVNSSIHYTYNEYKNDPASRIQYRNGSSFSGNINWTWVISPFITTEGATRYNVFADPQGSSRANLSYQLGIQQKLIQRKMTVSILIVDPFMQQKFRTFTQAERFELSSLRFNRTTNVKIGVAYNLTPNPGQKNRNKVMEAVKKLEKS